MYDIVCPQKLTTALSWLKQQNCLYADVIINNDWLNDSISNNLDLLAGLTGQPQHIYNIPRDVITDYDKHYNILVEMANEHAFIIHDVVGNGDCLFNSICYQLKGQTTVDANINCLSSFTKPLY